MAENASAEIYRQTMLGDALCDVLEAFVENGKLNEAMAETIMKQFDMSFLEALRTNETKATINADLKTYKFFDNVWQFTLERVRVRLTGTGTVMPEICCNKAKVVCVDYKTIDPKQEPSRPS